MIDVLVTKRTVVAIDVLGDLDDQAANSALHDLDAILTADPEASILVRLNRLVAYRWDAICSLVSGVLAARGLGANIFIEKPRSAMRSLLDELGAADAYVKLVDADPVRRHIIIARNAGADAPVAI